MQEPHIHVSIHVSNLSPEQLGGNLMYIVYLSAGRETENDFARGAAGPVSTSHFHVCGRTLCPWRPARAT
jgi:hypothetical protein